MCPVTVWTTWATVVNKTNQGACSHGVHALVGKAKKNPEITIMYVGVVSVFLHSCLTCGPTCQLQQFIHLPAWHSNPTDLGQWIITLRRELTQHAITKHCLTDSAPQSMKERKAGLALLPKLSSGVGFFHCFLICSFWDLIVKMSRGIKYRWESHLELKMTSRSPKPASMNLQCWLSAL